MVPYTNASDTGKHNASPKWALHMHTGPWLVAQLFWDVSILRPRMNPSEARTAVPDQIFVRNSSLPCLPLHFYPVTHSTYTLQHPTPAWNLKVLSSRGLGRWIVVKPASSPKTKVRTLAAPSVFSDAFTDCWERAACASCGCSCSCTPCIPRYAS